MKTFRLFSTLFVLLFSTLAPPPASAQEEARAAWQVTRYDITADIGSATGAERALTARAVIYARNVGGAAANTFTVRLNPKAEVKSASVGDGAARFNSRDDSRARLQQVTLTLNTPVAPGGTVNVTLEYRLPVVENSGLAALSGEATQFLPLSSWYPTPNTSLSTRGADYAPLRLTVKGLSGGETAISTGQASAAGFEQTLNAQPFFVTGKWDTVEGSGDARGVSAFLNAGASAEERGRAEALIALAASARSFYATLLGPAPETPVRLVGVRRGAGFDMAGTLLLDHAVFRRTKIDSITAVQIAETIARLWIGGQANIQGEGSGVVREGLPRFLATLFLEKQFGKDAAGSERIRMAQLYASIARRDAPLSQTTPALDLYYNAVVNKGALVWRLLMNAVGRDYFLDVLRREFAAGRQSGTSLAALRAALGERGSESLRGLLTGLFDQTTDTDFLVGLPQQRGGGWAVALRNMGSLDADVTVAATTERGERLTVSAHLPAKDFGEALFQTGAKLVRVEVDPEKLYPQIDFSNDVAPRTPGAEESLAGARSQLASQPARSEQLAREVLARAPSMSEARIVLGRALLEQNRLDDAEKEFRAALDAALPTPATLAWADIGLGEVALRRNNAAEAARRFNTAARADAEYASTLAAHAARLKAEAAGTAPPAVDEAVKNAVAQLDTAIRSGRKAELDANVVPGELASFVRGIVGTQPEAWQTRVQRTEALGANRLDADVLITAKTSGRDFVATAVMTFTRQPAGWRLTDIRYFEERKPNVVTP